MLILMLGLGLYLTLKTRFFQFRRLGASLKGAFSGGGTDGVSPFQASCTALAATLGTGNIVGVTGIIALCGGGVIFWMVVSAFLSMIIKFAEITLTMLYRKRVGGEFAGGPMYYIKYGLPPRFLPLAFIFSSFALIAVLGSGNMVQVNTLLTGINGILPEGNQNIRFYVNLLVAVFCAVSGAAILLGGAKRIGLFAERCVPFITLLYTALALAVIIPNISRLPSVFADIIKGAFNPKSVAGGGAATLLTVIRRGVSRGIFSNEAGLGTAPMAYANTVGKSPVKVGMMGIFEVFCDTVLVCTLTGIAVLSSGADIYGLSPAAAVFKVFESALGGIAVPLISLIICFFAYTAYIGWGVYAASVSGFLFGYKFSKAFTLIYCLTCILALFINNSAVWELSEALNGIMALPNLLAIFLLTPKVINEMGKEDI
ncbi:MAG: amino acid carrier protein [Clostridia bacterium]|nr:amino acid carrier protein [Clostridia bacterium]